MAPITLHDGIARHLSSVAVSSSGDIHGSAQRHHHLRNELTTALLTIDESLETMGTRLGRSDKLLGFPDDGTAIQWTVLGISVLVFLLLDVFLFQRYPGSIRNHCCILIFWLSAGICFNCYVWLDTGSENGLSWTNGYLLEWMLSIDNLLVFSILFRTYHTPPELLHKALFFGLIGAVFFRLAIYATLARVLAINKWVQPVLGVILIYSGAHSLLASDDNVPIESTRLVAFLRRIFGGRLEERYDTEEKRLFIVADGKLKATMLFFVIVCLEITDLLFAFDSVSAKIVAVPNDFIAFSSTVLAMFALRGVFFLLHRLVMYVETLRFAVPFVVSYIGLSILFAQVRPLPQWTTSAVSAVVFAVCILVSICKRQGGGHEPQEEGPQQEKAEDIKQGEPPKVQHEVQQEVKHED
jgi:tellurite resistance protein TerC